LTCTPLQFPMQLQWKQTVRISETAHFTSLYKYKLNT